MAPPVRKIGLASRTYRHVNRYRQILSVLFKYGFEGLVERLRIGQYIEIGWKLINRSRAARVEAMTTPERVRVMLEELGPTFVKLGQVLSTRPDLIPPEFVTEFAKLRQQVPPFPFAQVKQTIEAELERPLEEVFERFDQTSLAAASIGQVHRATLRGGEDVVVKVQRPGIEDIVEVDLEILLHLATLAEKHVEDWRSYRPSRVVEEFSRVLERELDFRAEATHLERFAREFQNDDTVYVPKVYRAFTTQRVLTMEYVAVVPATDVDALTQAGYDPQEIARRGTELTLKQIFVHGFFHADPHPGNVFVLPGNVICFLDFGMMGRLDRHSRENFADLIYSVARRDADAVTHALLRITSHDPTQDLDLRRIEADVAEVIDLYIPQSLRDLDFTKLIHEILALVHRNHLVIPPDMVMMMKAAATAEQFVSRLDPKMNVIASARPYVKRLKMARFHPRRLMRDAILSGGEILEFAREIPGSLRDLLHLSRTGGLRIGFEHRGLEKLLAALERSANRVSFAIVAAALIVGSSLIIHSRVPPTWGGIPVIGLVGFIVAGLMGLLLLVAILRHGRL